MLMPKLLFKALRHLISIRLSHFKTKYTLYATISAFKQLRITYYKTLISLSDVVRAYWWFCFLHEDTKQIGLLI